MRLPPKPPVFDIALSAVLVVIAVSEVWLNSGIPAKPASTVIEVAMAVAVAWRRAAPLGAAAVVAAACVADAAIGVPPDQPMLPTVASVILLYSVVSYCPLRRAVAGTVILLAGVTAQVVVAHQSLANLVWIYTFLGVFWAIGRLVRIRTNQAVAAELKVEHLRDEQEREAVRVAAEERGRIARELHDIIGHSVSVMVVQAGAAQQVLRADADAAERALESIQTAGRQAVGELGRLLDVLRDAGPEVGLAPQPTLAELPNLLAQTESAGLPVALRTQGEPRPLPAGVELAVYRIVQEALTNTRKHAGPGASASVVLTYAPHEIGVEVSDDGPAARARDGMREGAARDGAVRDAAVRDGAVRDGAVRDAAREDTVVAGTGHGLVGMRERVTAYGGRLAAGRAGGSGFTVSARIPVQAGE